MMLQTAIRWTMVLALLAGATVAQQAPATKTANAASSAVKEQQEIVPANGPATSNQTESESPAFNNWKEKLSYAFGVDLARDLKSQNIDLDVDLMVTALRDALAGSKLRMTRDDVAATLKRFEDERKQDFEHAKAMRSERNKREGEAFFARNVKQEGVVTLPSGLQYKVLKQGNGKKPKLEDNVVCHYRGTLLDGTEFDSSYKRGKPVTLPIKALIKGWSEALPLMPEGSSWQIFVPPQLAYGERIVGGIGPNAMLIFEVELISIESVQTAQVAQQDITTAGTK